MRKNKNNKKNRSKKTKRPKGANKKTTQQVHGSRVKTYGNHKVLAFGWDLRAKASEKALLSKGWDFFSTMLSAMILSPHTDAIDDAFEHQVEDYDGLTSIPGITHIEFIPKDVWDTLPNVAKHLLAVTTWRVIKGVFIHATENDNEDTIHNCFAAVAWMRSEGVYPEDLREPNEASDEELLEEFSDVIPSGQAEVFSPDPNQVIPFPGTEVADA